jgi:arylsulfatase A-like enzyme
MRFILLSFVILLILNSCISTKAEVVEEKKQPNIILFLVDDLGWQDTSVPFWTEKTHFNKSYHTPNLEKLAASGLTFTSAYATPVCSPSRVSLMTGMNAARHRVTNWTLHPNKMQPMETNDSLLSYPFWNVNGISSDPSTPHAVSVTTLAQQLKNHGYHTIHAGKAHFGAKKTPGANPLNLGFDVNIAGHAAGAPGSYYGTENFGNGKRSNWAVPGLEEYHGTDIFLTEVLTQKAIASLNGRNLEEPFYLYMAYYGVHTPIMADERFYHKYLSTGMDTIEAKYASMIESMDKSVGDVLTYLDDNKLTDETIILFMSDNGGLSAHTRAGQKHIHNWPLKSGKGSVYEGGIRVPMIASWEDKFPTGKRVDTPIIIEDFYPTILELIGVDGTQITHDIDGHSFADNLYSGETDYHDRPLVWHYPNNWGVGGPGIGSYSAMRSENFKFIYNHLSQEVEVYDLANDIFENNNLYPAELETTKKLAEKLSQYLKKTNAQLPTYKFKKREVAYPSEALKSIQPQAKTYSITNIRSSSIHVDGNLEDIWNKAHLLSDITAPWNDSLTFVNEFKALHNEENIYFSFVVKDDDIHLENNYEDEESNAVRSDRVELFFRRPYHLSPYYAFEMDAQSRLFDSRGLFYQRIDSSWDIDENEFRIQTSFTDSGYILEGMISKKVLKELDLVGSDGSITTGIFRGNYHSDSDKVEWISWVKPTSDKPDFHIPSSYGKMILEE